MRNDIMSIQEYRECQSCKKYGFTIPLKLDESGRWVCPLCDYDY
jgi:transposase-like protein